MARLRLHYELERHLREMYKQETTTLVIDPHVIKVVRNTEVSCMVAVSLFVAYVARESGTFNYSTFLRSNET